MHIRKVLFLDSTHPLLVERLKAAGFEVIYKPGISYDDFMRILPELYGMILRSRFVINKTILDKAINLQFIGRVGSGMENIEVQCCESKGIKCFNSPEGNRQAVAEHCLGFLLGMTKNILRSNEEVKRGIWRREANRGVELRDKTMGLIGYGNTGSSFAKVLRGLGMKIFAYDKYKTGYGDTWVTESSMEMIFENTEILSLHVPYTEETHYLVDENYLRQFKKPIFLINTSRGSIVQTSALLKMMNEGRVKKAALDVLEYEDHSFESFFDKPLPAGFRALQEHPDIILTPHIGGWTEESNEKLSTILADKIINSF